MSAAKTRTTVRKFKDFPRQGVVARNAQATKIT